MTHPAQLSSPLHSCFSLSCAASSLAKSGFQEVVKAFADGAQSMFKAVATFWVKVPDPQLGAGTGPGQQIAGLVTDESWVIALLATFGFLVGIGRLVWANRVGQSARELVRGLIVLSVAASLTTAVFTTLLQAGNGYSDWILQQATGKNTTGDAFTAIITQSLKTSTSGIDSALGAWFLLFLLLILGALMQVVFMVIRGAVIYVLAVFIPVFAADSWSEEGWARFKRALMLMFAFTIYKPVAATIYATGFQVLHSPGDSDQGTASLMTGIYGLTILILAAIALPALIKFLVPIAAMGSSSAFSGGAALGAIATGAAAVATMGAGAGAGAGASGASMAGGGGSGSAFGGGGSGSSGGGSGGGAGPTPDTGGSSGGGSGGGSKGGGLPGGQGLGGGSDSDSDGGGGGIIPTDTQQTASGGSGGSASDTPVPVSSAGGGAPAPSGSTGDTPAAHGGGGSGSSSPAASNRGGGNGASSGSSSPAAGGASGASGSAVAPPTLSGSSGGGGGGSSRGGGGAQVGGQVAQQVVALAADSVPDGAEEAQV